MKKFNFPLTPKKIASKLDCATDFNSKVALDNVAELHEANEHSVCFFENPKFMDALRETKAGLIFVPKDFDKNLKPNAKVALSKSCRTHSISSIVSVFPARALRRYRR